MPIDGQVPRLNGPPFRPPKLLFWENLQLKLMESILAFFLTTDKAIITKLGQNIKQIELYNLGIKGAWPRSRDLLLNFGNPSISLERLKLETSNLVGRMTKKSSTKKCKIRGQRGHGLGHVTYF